MTSCPGVLPAESETAARGIGHGNMKLVTVFGGTGFLGRLHRGGSCLGKAWPFG